MKPEERIWRGLKEALERYTDAELREFIRGAVEFNAPREEQA